MKITTILCNYNGSAFLTECIESVFTQSRPADEFIIVDDGSTDDSYEVIKELIAGKANVRLFEHGTNKGQGAGFNTAIEAATGEWLCFIDSDDSWYPDKLCEVVEAAGIAGDIVMIQHPLKVVEGVTMTDRISPVAMTFGDLWFSWHHHIYFPVFVPTTGLAIRADIAKKVLPIPKHLRHSADSFLTRSTIPYGKVHAITKPLGIYRQHDQNAVLGNEAHDSGKFFLEQVAPYLHTYYLKCGMPSPIPKLLPQHEPHSLFRTLMNTSPRSLLRHARRFLHKLR
jgi:glycosyltransferase involved in cell wall biosynthesis